MRIFRTRLLPLCLLSMISAARAQAACDLGGLAPGSQVAEIQTSLGSFCIELLGAAAPAHVANFLFYLQAGELTGSFFHRSVPGFILQGGSVRLDGPDAGNDYDAVPATNGPVTNEPCTLDTPVDPNNPGGTQMCSVRGNVRGTVALAKVGGNPSSGTTSWFVNLADNRANLDNQNGGFTVFGRVIGSGMTVVDAIAALQLATPDNLAWLNTALESSPIPLSAAPLSSAQGCFDPTLQTTVVNYPPPLPNHVPVLDPVIPGIWYTASASCGSPTTVATFDPNSVAPGCAVPAPDRFSVRTSGPRTLLFPGGTPAYFKLTCLQIEQMLAQRAIWLVAYRAHLDAHLIFITAASSSVVAAVPVLPGWGTLLLLLAILLVSMAGAVRRAR